MGTLLFGDSFYKMWRLEGSEDSTFPDSPDVMMEGIIDVTIVCYQCSNFMYCNTGEYLYDFVICR